MMDDAKRARLESAGWRAGNVDEFFDDIQTGDLLDRLPQVLRLEARSFAGMPWRWVLVGGTVRAALTGTVPHDLDFAVEGCPSPDVLHEVLTSIGRVTRNGFNGCRMRTSTDVQIDAWRVEDNVLRPCATAEELVCGGVTFDADAGGIDVARPREVIDGGVRNVLRTGQFDLLHLRGLKTPPTSMIAARAANLVSKHGWRIGPRLRGRLDRHSEQDGSRLWESASAYASTGYPHLTARRIAELLGYA